MPANHSRAHIDALFRDERHVVVVGWAMFLDGSCPARLALVCEGEALVFPDERGLKYERVQRSDVCDVWPSAPVDSGFRLHVPIQWL